MSGQNREVIGDFVELRFVALPSSSFIRGKVDTGATICSLHCDKFQVNEQSQQITFKCSQLSNNSITVPMTEQQAVKNADGTEYRPVIEMSVKIGEQIIENVKFNLNNRSTMDSPVLIGQNLIKAGNFLIDPKQVAEAMTVTRMDDEENIDADAIIDTVMSALNKKEVDDSDTTEIGNVATATDDELEQDIDDTELEQDIDDTELEQELDSTEIEDEIEEPMDEERQAQIAELVDAMRTSDVTLAELIEYLSGSD